jgi:uncharacterized integral membrane protein (TIGR00698 family)
MALQVERRNPGQQNSSKALGGIVPGLLLVLAGTAVANVVSQVVGPLSTLVSAVIVGALLGNLGMVTPVTAPGLGFVAKRILRVGVVLLGLRLSLGDVFDLGAAALIVVAMTVVATFFGTQWMGPKLGLSRDLSLLVATGFSICGASAIAAVESSTDADEEEVAAAIGLVTLFGSIAIVALPLLAGPLGLGDIGFGTWVGASVHDVAQVVATASTGGSAVLAVAIVVKLTRVALLAPIVAGVNLQRRQDWADDAKRAPILPLFVAGFLAMIVVRSSGLLGDGIIAEAKAIEGWLLAAALVGLGSGVRFDKLRKLGPRPLVLGALAWIVVATVSYLGVRLAVQ